VDPLIESFIEVSLPSPDNFLKVKETLTRIGISSKSERKLYQSCHILHKKGKYYIVHFKELFMLDGLESDFVESDRARRNTIANLLEQWGLVKIMNPQNAKEPTCPISHFKILPFSEKKDWELVPKYRIGIRKKPLDEDGN
jgi:hypothetical protein